MAKKPTLSFEQWVTRFIENVMFFFNLAGWRVSIEYLDETPENGDGDMMYAHISILSSYQSAIISVSAEARVDYESKNFERLIGALVHEVVHIFIDPFADFTKPHLSEVTRPLFFNIVEAQTQRLTMVLLKTLPKELIP